MARTPDDTPTTVGSVAGRLGGAAPGSVDVVDDLPRHPVADFTTRLRHRLDQLTAPKSRPVWAMTTDELRTTLLDLATAQAQLDALRLAVLAEAERNGSILDPGDRSIADWYARETRTRRNVARADLKLAHALDDGPDGALPHLTTGMATGSVSLDQARSIKRSLDLLPVSGEFAVDGDQREAAEAHLVDLAAHHDAADLDHLGRRIYTVIAPEAADAYEGRLLEAEEARAARKTVFETWTDHQGLTHGRFRIPKLHGAMLTKALDAIMSPLRDHTGPTSRPTESTQPTESTEEPTTDRRPLPVRRGEAFCELLERLSARDLPVTAGGDATIVVTIRHDDLLAALDAAGVATLDTGQRISAAEARRLACGHQLLPAVLDGTSHVLDLGRSKRLHTKAQRTALGIEQGGCTAEHCDVPAAQCHAHHDRPWSEGGDTTLANGRLLCGPHHRRIHDPAHLHEVLPDGSIRFHRRP